MNELCHKGSAVLDIDHCARKGQVAVVVLRFVVLRLHGGGNGNEHFGIDLGGRCSLNHGLGFNRGFGFNDRFNNGLDNRFGFNHRFDNGFCHGLRFNRSLGDGFCFRLGKYGHGLHRNCGCFSLFLGLLLAQTISDLRDKNDQADQNGQNGEQDKAGGRSGKDEQLTKPQGGPTNGAGVVFLGQNRVVRRGAVVCLHQKICGAVCAVAADDATDQDLVAVQIRNDGAVAQCGEVLFEEQDEAILNDTVGFRSVHGLRAHDRAGPAQNGGGRIALLCAVHYGQRYA